MKKSLLLSVSLLAAATALVGQASESGNTFGVQRVDSKSAQTIVCIPWIDTSTGGDIAVADIVKTANLTPAGTYDDIYYPGDELRWYNTETGGFVVWNLNENRVWAKGEGQSEYDPLDAKTLPRGQAIGIVRKNPTDSVGNAIPFYVHGQVPANEAAKVSFPTGSTATPVYTLFAPPIASVSGVNVNDARWTWTNVKAATSTADGDQLMIVTDSGLLVLFWDGTRGWGEFGLTKDDFAKGVYKSHWMESTRAKISAGCGAWFVSRDDTPGKKVSWAPTQQ